jgi:hypothetical protein
MKARVTQIIVLPEDEPIFSERGYTITIRDEAAGEYIEIEDHQEGSKVAINPEEWPAIRAAINRMVKECRDEKE